LISIILSDLSNPVNELFLSESLPGNDGVFESFLSGSGKGSPGPNKISSIVQALSKVFGL